MISEEIERVNRSFHGLKVEKQVPCSCGQCLALTEPHFYEFSDLMRRKEKGKETVECKISYEDVEVQKLLDSVSSEDGLSWKERMFSKLDSMDDKQDRHGEKLGNIHADVRINQSLIKETKAAILDEIEQSTELQLLSATEQLVFFEKMEAMIAALPKQEQKHYEGWQNQKIKQKLKICLDLKLLKYEAEYDISDMKRPKSWAEFKAWFIRNE